jgi:hypothetical protein
MSPRSSDMSPWDEARSLEDLAQATIAFLRGELDHTPTHGGPPNHETGPLIESLIALNEASFVTVNSQPGAVDPAGAQRAYVEGLCSEETATRVINGLLGTELVVLSFAPGTNALGSIAVTVDDGEPFTFLGRHDASHVEFFHNGSSDLADALAQAWVLQVFDPVWGRTQQLWAKLAGALTRK